MDTGNCSRCGIPCTLNNLNIIVSVLNHILVYNSVLKGNACKHTITQSHKHNHTIKQANKHACTKTHKAHKHKQTSAQAHKHTLLRHIGLENLTSFHAFQVRNVANEAANCSSLWNASMYSTCRQLRSVCANERIKYIDTHS